MKPESPNDFLFYCNKCSVSVNTQLLMFKWRIMYDLPIEIGTPRGLFHVVMNSTLLYSINICSQTSVSHLCLNNNELTLRAHPLRKGSPYLAQTADSHCTALHNAGSSVHDVTYSCDRRCQTAKIYCQLEKLGPRCPAIRVQIHCSIPFLFPDQFEI